MAGYPAYGERTGAYPAWANIQITSSFPGSAKLIKKTTSHSSEELPRRKTRVVLYSHDTLGLGHIRRNLLIAQALTQSGANVDILLITGSREAGNLPIPAGVGCLALPSLYKETNGQYRPRYMKIPLHDVISLRSKILSAAIIDFDPDVLIVDTVARGALGELQPTLEHLHSETDTQVILGLRDICDAPFAVERDWREYGTEEALRNYYDKVWVYGDPTVYDPVNEYNFPADVAAKVCFTGYLDQRDRLRSVCMTADHLSPDYKSSTSAPYILCMLGGGQDGVQLADAFVETGLLEGLQRVLLCGPHMEIAARKKLHQRARQNSDLVVFDFIPEPAKLVQEAEAIVCMGGYNSVCEALSHNKRVLIVPRVKPRREQLIRAQKFVERNIAHMLHPDMLNPCSLNEAIQRILDTPQTDVHAQIDFEGLKKLPGLLAQLTRPSSRELLHESG
jgi:predicted glycosyltransferase